MSAQLYVPAHREELNTVDWFFIVGAIMMVAYLLFRAWIATSAIHCVAATGWLLAVSNYYTARKRYNPRLH